MSKTCLLVLCVIVIFSAMPLHAASDVTTRPGTIPHAIAQPDGTSVYLDAVVVGKIKAHQNPAYIVVSEMWKPGSRIVVCCAPPEQLRMGQTVDIEGVLGTLPNGMRVILDPRVIGYYTSAGELLTGRSVTKGLLQPTAWQWKADLVIPADPSGDPVPGEPNLDPTPVACHPSIASLLADSSSRAAKLECKQVVAKGVDAVFGSFVVLGDDTSPATIKVFCPVEGTSGVSSAEAGDESRVNSVEGQVQTLNGETVLLVDGGPSYDPQGFQGNVQTVQAGTATFARTLSDTATVSVEGVVTERFPASGVFYVENADRSGGIRISYASSPLPARASVVDVTGTLGTTPDGERVIVAGPYGVTTISGPAQPVKPVAIINRALGGSSFNEFTPGISYPAAAAGLYNKGMLVRICGRVTAVDPGLQWFYVDDGSAISDGVGPAGVKVALNVEGGAVSAPAVGDYLADLVGVSSSESVEGQYARLLLLRNIGKPIVGGEAVSKKADLFWTTEDATVYRLYRSTSEGGLYELVTATSSGAFTDAGLTNGQIYYYKVSASACGIEGAGATIALTPTGGSPTVDSSYDPLTSTYIYTVTCPLNNEFAFGQFVVNALTPNAAPTGPWTATGPVIGGNDQAWAFSSVEQDPSTGNTSAIWAAAQNIPENTSVTARFTLTVPGSEPVSGTAITSGPQAGSTLTHDVVVPKKPAPQVTNPPVTTFNLTGTLGDNDWYTTPVTVEIIATDPEDDYDKSYYKLDDMSAEWTEYAETFDVSDNGEHLIAAYSTDTAGNSEDPNNPVTSTFKIDGTAPDILATPATQPNANGWYKSEVSIDYSVADATSGLASPQLADPGETIGFTHTVTGEGANLSDSAGATDMAGNTATKEISGIKIDKTAPVVTLVSSPAGRTNIINYDTAVIKFNVADSLSGIDGAPWVVVNSVPTEGWANPGSTTYNAVSVGGSAYQISFAFLVPGVYSATAYAKDKAGNTGQMTVPITFSAGGFTVEWLPPISTMETYIMQDGSTVPVKFRLLDPNNNSVWVNTYLYTVKVIDTASKVWLTVQCPQPDNANAGYQANVKTKDANGVKWPVGDYTVIIEGPGIWDMVSGPYRSRYGLELVDGSTAKGKGKR